MNIHPDGVDRQLEGWHQLLRAGEPRLLLLLEATKDHLKNDPIAPLRRQGLKLLQRLSQHPPAAEERLQLADLHQQWGDLVVVDAPGLARHHYERAWACYGRQPVPQGLRQRLADLAWRQGLQTGAWALAAPGEDLPPWNELPCAGIGCPDCQDLLRQEPLAERDSGNLELIAIPEGSIWCHRANAWGETYGVAACDGAGNLLMEHCRAYPWALPDCRWGQTARQQLALQQMQWQLRRQPATQRQPGAVLAVADLSAELYYHAQLELLPRLGRAWQQLQAEEPELRLWHNGGDGPAMREALQRLGIPPERVLNASAIPHLQAEQLWLVSWPSPFGAPGPWALEWLRGFWEVGEAEPSSSETVLWLPRGSAARRPMLQEAAWIEAMGSSLAAQGLQLQRCSGGPVREQLERAAGARAFIAPHGGAMANLLAAGQGTAVLELVNPAYAPPYFAGVMARAGMRRRVWASVPTPEPLARVLYTGPLEFPIDAGPVDANLPPLLQALEPLLRP
jgi:hypothetical protein